MNSEEPLAQAFSSARPWKAVRAQPQLAAVGPEEVHQRNDAAYELAENGGQHGALGAPLQHRHEQSVQHDVGEAGGNGDVQAQLRPLRRHQKALEGVLQHIGVRPSRTIRPS